MSLRLEISHLRALVATSREGTFTAAARRLHLTQSAVSWQVKRLEDRVGQTLLRRTAEGVVPTTAGRRMLVYAERVLDAHDEAVSHLTGAVASGGPLRFGCAEDLIVSHLGGILARFRALAPGVQMEIVVDQSAVLRRRVAEGDLHAAVFQASLGGAPADATVLWREPPLWVRAPGSAVERQRPLPLVTFEQGCMYRAVAGQTLDNAGISWYPVVECASVAGIRAAVEAGVGVGMLAPRQLGRGVEVVPAGGLLPVLPESEFVLLRSSLLDGGTATAVLAELLVSELTIGHRPARVTSFASV